MIIKKWTGSAWQAQSAKTNAADLVVDVTAVTPTTLFDIAGANIKLKPAYLPDSVFDGLTFYSTTTGDVASANPRGALASTLLTMYHTFLNSGDVKGKYFVINTAGTITGLTAIQETLIPLNDPGDGEWATLQFRPQDGGTSGSPNTSSGVLEAGDWFVIESVNNGLGTQASPRVFTAAVINNVYEIMGAAAAGTAGTPGLVPSSLAGDQAKFLRADATWAFPTDLNTTYSISTVNGGDNYSEKIRLTDSAAATDDVTIAVGAVNSVYGLTIEQASDVITIKHADTSSQASVNSNTGRTYIQNITLDEYGHVTIIDSATETVVDTNTTYSISAVDGTTGKKIIRLTAGGSGSGTDDVTLVQGTNTTLTRANDEITIEATAYTAGNGISLASYQFSVGAGVGLTQEATGLKMTQPFVASATQPSASYQVTDNLWFQL
jgi:hypothetical protein